MPGATVTNKFDFNRDGTVSVIDQLLSRNNITTAVSKLKQITVPAVLQAGGLTAQGLSDSAGDIARGLALAALDGSTAGASGASSQEVATSSARKLQAQALATAFDEGDSLPLKRRVATSVNDLEGDLLELLAAGR